MFRETLDKTDDPALPAGLACLAVLALIPHFRNQLGESFTALEDANTGWLWVAAAAFVAALFCSASAWRAATKLPDRLDAYARYGVGSLVNSFAPAHAGDAVRLALFAKASPGDHKCLTAGKALAGVALMRLACVGVLLLATMKPIALLLLLLAPLLGRVPVWVAAATVARVAAAAAVAAAMGIPAPDADCAPRRPGDRPRRTVRDHARQHRPEERSDCACACRHRAST